MPKVKNWPREIYGEHMLFLLKSNNTKFYLPSFYVNYFLKKTLPYFTLRHSGPISQQHHISTCNFGKIKACQSILWFQYAKISISCLFKRISILNWRWFSTFKEWLINKRHWINFWSFKTNVLASHLLVLLK